MVSAVFGSCNKNVFFLVAGVMLVFRRSATVRSLDSALMSGKARNFMNA